MRLVAYDPFVSADRARQLGVQLVPTVEELVAISDFVTIHATKTPGHDRARQRRRARARQAGHAADQRRTGRHRRRGRARRRDRATAGSAAPAIDTFAKEPTTESPLFALDNVVVTPHLGRVDGRGAGQGGGDDRRAGGPRACAATSCRSPSTLPRPRRRRSCGRSCRSPNGSAGCSPGSPAVRRATLEVDYEGEIADYDCRVLTLSILKGVLAPVVDEPVSFVNAPQLAEQRGISVRETKSSDARDYVNLIVVRGDQGNAGRGDAVRQATGAAHRRHRRPPGRPAARAAHARRAQRRHARDDRPGRRRVLGDAGINISDMDVGRSPSGEAALMVIATDSPVPAEIVARDRRATGRASRPRHRPRLSAFRPWRGGGRRASPRPRRRSNGRASCGRSSRRRRRGRCRS